MNKNVKSFIVNTGLLISGVFAIFTGMLIQTQYHMGNHGNINFDKSVLEISYSDWSAIHKLTIIVLSIFIAFHFALHWKWYKAVIGKGLINKNIQVITLTILFTLVAITGFVPWFIDLQHGHQMIRKAFIEIHDKLAIVLSIYLILHVIKRMKWFFSTYKKIVE